MARKKQETLVLFPEVLTVTRKLSDEQFGVLMRAAFSYRLNGEVYAGDDVAVDVAFQFVSNQIDRYIDNCSTNARNATGSNAECSEIQRNAAELQQNPPPILSNPVHSNLIESTANESPPTPTRQSRKAFGEFGWVKLTDDEYNRLLNDLGETEVKRCIAYVDESAQTTRNKNKWRDWNLVVRKCSKQGWGINQKQNNTGGYEHGVDRLARMYKEEYGG